VRLSIGYPERLEDSVAACRRKIQYGDLGERGIDQLKGGRFRSVRRDVRRRSVEQSERGFRHAFILVASARLVLHQRGRVASIPGRGRGRVVRRAARQAVGMSVPYEETQLMPLATDEDIERRVADLVGRANSRQLWLFFLDETDVQLPLLVPIEGLPAEPTAEQATGVVYRVRELMGEIGATSVVTVLERYGSSALTAQDAAWVRALRTTCESSGVVLRAQLLSHRTGVRLIDTEETSTS
jgi:hypothetical protein